MPRSLLHCPIVALAALGAAACGGAASPETTASGPATAGGTTPEQDAAPRIVRGADGAEVSFDALVEALLPAQVILLGERHDRAADHDMQRRVTEAVLAREPSAALGFEMFQRPFQAPLDDYGRGAIDEAELLARTEWDERWGFDFAMYRPLVGLGPSRRLPLLALNAPQEVTRTIGREGLDALDEGQRAALPELDLEDAAHREVIMAAFEGHPGMSEAMLQRFYTAQVVWDETMAETVADHLRSETAAERVFVYAGTMHVMRPAIPARVARRVPTETAIVMPVSPADVAEARELADFLWVTP